MSNSRFVKALIGVCLAWSMPIPVGAEPNEYQALSSILAAQFAGVPSEEIVREEELVFDSSIRKPLPAASTATATLDNLFGYRGMPLHKHQIMVLLEPGATAGQVSSLLSQYSLNVSSVVPEIGLLIVEVGSQTPASLSVSANAENDETRSLRILTNTIADLEQSDIVRTAAVNVLMYPTVVTPRGGSGIDRSGEAWHWDWAKKVGDGNWGLKNARFPAAWNFSDAIRREGNTAVLTGVLDTGFGSHEDLQFTVCSSSSTGQEDHGNHVAGIIGASHRNTKGIDGATPFASLKVCGFKLSETTNTIPRIFPILSNVIAALTTFILESEGLKAINISLGYNWVPNFQRNPNTDGEIKDLVKAHGIIVRAIADLAASRGIILVSAAGNDSHASAGFANIKAQWASPFNWAALNAGNAATPAQNVLVVESYGRSGDRSSFSNVEGTVAAPGESILSSVLGQDRYAVFNGTSMAAPHVTALVSLLYAYNPALTVSKVIEIVKTTAQTSPGRAPSIDAFAALVAANADSFKDLADLTADGAVDMQDFAILKAAVRQIRGQVPQSERQDLNQDGEVDDNENIFPRTDLNGSGVLSTDASDRRKVGGDELLDLDVMIKAWQDTNVPSSQLPALLNQ